MKDDDVEHCGFCKGSFSDRRPAYPIGTGQAHSDCLAHGLQRVGGHSPRYPTKEERLTALRTHEEIPAFAINVEDLEAQK